MSKACTNELTGSCTSRKTSRTGLIDAIEMDSGLQAKHYGQLLYLHNSSISSNQQHYRGRLLP